MTWMPEVPSLDLARERTEKALAVPLGMASPLWIAFGAAAGMGMAWWWMTRWGRAVNLEAMFANPTAVTIAAEVAAPVAIEASEPVWPKPPVLEAAPVEAASEVVEAVAPEPAPPPPAPAEPAVAAPADDLTRMVGVGAKLAASLAERGVTRFEHIAGWTAEDIAAIDADLKLLGRATRDAWVAQARRFAAEV